MSNSHRNAKYANADIVVSVSVDDFAKEGFTGPLAGLEFQRHWEKKAYELGGGKFYAPAQSIPDYLAGTLRGVLPIGEGSTSTARRIPSKPSIAPCVPTGPSALAPIARRSAG
jgi:uncharacterized FAD-dependent dehydrogenase